MIRYTLLLLFISFLCTYAFKNWFKALCFSLPLLAMLERPDMPRAMLGISGLNPYNIVLGFILIAWLSQKKKEQLNWNLPKNVNRYLILFLLVSIVAFIRMIMDPSGFQIHAEYFNAFKGNFVHIPSVGSLYKDDLFNAWKWLIPGLLICHGANTPERARMVLVFLLITGVLLALQVIIKMAPALVGLDDLHRRSMRVFNRDIGYHKAELAPFVGATAWACVVYASSSVSKLHQRIALCGFLLCSVALVATGGRGGAMAWFACACLFGLLRWRNIIIFGPILAVIALLLIPGAQERYTAGFSSESQEGISSRLDTVDSEGRDLYAITSGRVIVWPRVLEYVNEAPIFGYGLRSYEREGVFDSLHQDGILPFTAGFHSHPHNAYLALLLDTGIFGLAIFLLFARALLWPAIKRFYGYVTKPTDRAVAGFLLSYLVVEMVNGLITGTFYPKQALVLLWCAIGLFMASLRNSFDKTEEQGTHKRQLKK